MRPLHLFLGVLLPVIVDFLLQLVEVTLQADEVPADQEELQHGEADGQHVEPDHHVVEASIDHGDGNSGVVERPVVVDVTGAALGLDVGLEDPALGEVKCLFDRFFITDTLCGRIRINVLVDFEV